MRSCFLCIAVTVLSLSLATADEKPQVVKIVSSLPRSGGVKNATDPVVNGIKLAIKEADGKAGRFVVKYEDWDDSGPSGRWTAENESKNANAAVKDTDVVAYIGPFNSGAAMVSMPILNEARLLMVSPGCTAPTLTKAWGGNDEFQRYRPSKKVNFLRVVPTDDVQALRGADYLKSIGVKTVVLLDDGEFYGQGLSKSFLDACKSNGIQVLGDVITLDYRGEDFQTTLKGIKKKQTPDAIIFGGTTQTGAPQLVKDVTSLKLGSRLFVSEGCYEDEFLKAAGAEALDKVDCSVIVGGIDVEFFAGRGKSFAEKYRAEFSTNPTPYSVYGYDAANVVLTALAKADKKDRSAITEAALALDNYNSPLGKFAFDKNGDTTTRIVTVLQAKGTGFKYVKEFPDPAPTRK